MISDHPGSQGGLSSYYRVFDIMGRAVEASRPTEICATCPQGRIPIGDDLAYVYSRQDYDWKGRPRVTTNPDLTTRVISYTGCGCAGGDVVTSEGEQVTDPRGDLNRRKTETWHDVLGRSER